MSDSALFGPDNLPYGLFSTPDRPGHRRIGVRFGDDVLDLGAAAAAFGSAHADVLRAPSLNPLLALGRPGWQEEVRTQLRAWLTEDTHRETAARHLLPLSEVRLHLPFEVADYVDFYASEHHATNVGRIFRPDGDALTPNWKHLPIGYHGGAPGRSSSPGHPWCVRRASASPRTSRFPSSAPRGGWTSRRRSASSSAPRARWAPRWGWRDSATMCSV